MPARGNSNNSDDITAHIIIAHYTLVVLIGGAKHWYYGDLHSHVETPNECYGGGRGGDKWIFVILCVRVV